jgi:hypothetical protein
VKDPANCNDETYNKAQEISPESIIVDQDNEVLAENPEWFQTDRGAFSEDTSVVVEPAPKSTSPSNNRIHSVPDDNAKDVGKQLDGERKMFPPPQ